LFKNNEENGKLLERVLAIIRKPLEQQTLIQCSTLPPCVFTHEALEETSAEISTVA
jgi:hypothetical protein